LLTKLGKLPEFELGDDDATPGLAGAGQRRKHQFQHGALAESVRNNLCPAAFFAEQSLQQVRRARGFALSDGQAQMRDTGFEVVFKAGDGRRELGLV
jgi:hypothetical protein